MKCGFPGGSGIMVKSERLEGLSPCLAMDAGYEELRLTYRERFGSWPPVIFLPEELAMSLMAEALKKGEPLPAESFPGSGCACV